MKKKKKIKLLFIFWYSSNLNRCYPTFAKSNTEEETDLLFVSKRGGNARFKICCSDSPERSLHD